MDKQLSAQEIYDAFYIEAVSRARANGHKLPDEVEVFQVFVKMSRKAIEQGDAPPDFMDEVREVKAFQAREREEAMRMEARTKALKEGTILDWDDLMK